MDWWSSIDWGKTLQNWSVIIASATAIYGIGAWRREIRDRRRMELAEDSLASIYEIKDAIASIRGIFSMSGESEERERSEDETEGQRRALDAAYIVLRRYDNRSELFNRFYALRYRFQAIFGNEAASPFFLIREVTNELLTAAHVYAMLWRGAVAPKPETEEECQRKIYAVSSKAKDDPFLPRINTAIEKLEEICRPVILGQGALSRLWNRLTT